MNPIARLIEDEGFLYGICVPWLDYVNFARDIGRNVVFGPDKTGFSVKRFRKTFYNCKAVGFNCVRVWVLDFLEGIVYDDNGMAVGLDEDMVRNVRTVTELAEEYGIKLMMTFHAHTRYCMRNRFDEYKMYTKILFYPEYMESYCKNCIAPLAQYFSDKRHVIMLDMMAEPEGDIEGQDGNYMEYGGTWDSMRKLIGMMISTCKYYAPHIPVTAASGWKYYNALREGRYNGIGLDYIGVDIYNDTGELEAVDTLNCEKPVWLGEFGLAEATSKGWDDELHRKAMHAFYENAVAKGYVGAFFWMYGAPAAWDQQTLEDKTGKLRPTADDMHFQFLDAINKKIGRTYEEPVMLYPDSTDDLAWFSHRKAIRYRLERTQDREKWTAVLEMPAKPECLRHETKDETAETGIEYYYRAVAILPTGEEIFSATSPACKKKDQ